MQLLVMPYLASFVGESSQWSVAFKWSYVTDNEQLQLVQTWFTY